MFIGIINVDFDEFAGNEISLFLDIDQAVDFRCICGTACNRTGVTDGIDQNQLLSAYFLFQSLCADGSLSFHEALQAFLFGIFIHMVRQLVGSRAFNR